MTSQQMDLFEYLKTQTRTESPAPMLAILEAVEGSKSKQFKVSRALEAVADILAGEPEPKDKRFNQFVHKVGKAIKPELLRIEKAERVAVVRDAAEAQLCFEGGAMCGAPASLGELQELLGVEA